MAGPGETPEHKHGTMDTTAQERTFEGFIRKVVWGIGIAIGLLILAALLNA